MSGITLSDEGHLDLSLGLGGCSKVDVQWLVCLIVAACKVGMHIVSPILSVKCVADPVW